MYYEDLYTMPDKQLSCGVVANSTNLSNKKVLQCICFLYLLVKLII